MLSFHPSCQRAIHRLIDLPHMLQGPGSPSEFKVPKVSAVKIQYCSVLRIMVKMHSCNSKLNYPVKILLPQRSDLKTHPAHHLHKLLLPSSSCGQLMHPPFLRIVLTPAPTLPQAHSLQFCLSQLISFE